MLMLRRHPQARRKTVRLAYKYRRDLMKKIEQALKSLNLREKNMVVKIWAKLRLNP